MVCVQRRSVAFHQSNSSSSKHRRLTTGCGAFNAGSALISSSPARDEVAALAGVNTTLSGGMAGMVALFVNLLILERSTGEPFFDLKYAMNGSLCGLVAITAGCGGE